MKESEMRKGMRVLICSSKETGGTHTSTRAMERMVNKIYKIKYTATSRFGLAAIINGYYWHPKDLTIPTKPVPLKKLKPQHFDIKELVI